MHNYHYSYLLYIIGWFFLISTLLFYTWNNVLHDLFKVKKAKYWQALLIVATVCSVCLPRYACKSLRHGCGSGYSSGKCSHHGSSHSDGECPYSKKKSK